MARGRSRTPPAVLRCTVVAATSSETAARSRFSRPGRVLVAGRSAGTAPDRNTVVRGAARRMVSAGCGAADFEVRAGAAPRGRPDAGVAGLRPRSPTAPEAAGALVLLVVSVVRVGFPLVRPPRAGCERRGRSGVGSAGEFSSRLRVVRSLSTRCTRSWTVTWPEDFFDGRAAGGCGRRTAGASRRRFFGSSGRRSLASPDRRLRVAGG